MNEPTRQPLPTIITSLNQVEAATKTRELVELLCTEADQLTEITNEEEMAIAKEFVAQARGYANDLDTQRKEATAGAREIQKRVNEEFNAPIETAKTAANRVAGLVKARTLELQRQAEDQARQEREAREKAEREAREAEEAAEQARKDAEASGDETAASDAAQEAAEARQELDNLKAPPPPASVAKAEKTKGAMGSSADLRDNWVWEVEDITKVPAKYLKEPIECVRKPMLNSEVKALKDKTDIPGIRVFNDPQLVTRRAK